MDLIEEVLESTADFEPPRRFYYWSTLAAISAVLKDKVFFGMGQNYTLYPNIYVLLYGPSGIRKGPAIDLAESLVTLVDNTKVIDGRSSIEAVIKELGTAESREGKPMKKDACGFMVASELSSSIVNNPDAMNIMTNLYDRQYNDKEWKYRLKVSESARLLKPTITWLAGTNESLFNDFIPEKNLKGGLIGRMFIISETKKHRSNSLMFDTVFPNKAHLGNKLKDVSRLQGKFEMDIETRQFVDEWYLKFDKDEAPRYEDESGFVSRSLDFVIKVAMLIAAGRRQELKITPTDIVEAIDKVIPLINPTKKIVNNKKTDTSNVQKRILITEFIANKPGFQAERAQILRNLGLQINHIDLDETAALLIQQNALLIENQGGKTYYKLKTENPTVMEWVKSFRNGG